MERSLRSAGRATGAPVRTTRAPVALLRLALFGAACVGGYLLLVLFSPAAHADPVSPPVADVAEPVAGLGVDARQAIEATTAQAGDGKHTATASAAR